MGKQDFPEKAIFVCNGKKCGKHVEIRRYCKDAIKAHGLKKSVELISVNCLGRCKQAPVLCFQPDNAWYSQVTEKRIRLLLIEHLVKGK